MLKRVLSFAYGLIAYVGFLGVFLYAVAFVGGFAVPKTIDGGAAASEPPLVEAVLINAALLLLFAVQHSGMARQGFKRWWARVVPRHLHRSTYVLVASALLALVMWQWRPIPDVVWNVDGTGATALWALFGLGWSVVLVATFLINHFELFGLQQVVRYVLNREHRPPEFQTPGFYRFVRHPLYVGFMMAFWAIPTMTTGHLVFAVATTGYMLLAIQFEERDLVQFHGEKYERYRERVPMLIPRPGSAGGEGARRPASGLERAASE